MQSQKRWISLCFVLWLVACATEPSSSPVAPDPTETVAEITIPPGPTRTPSPTATTTLTPIPTATRQPKPSITPTASLMPENTPPPSPTPTPEATATSAEPQPSAIDTAPPPAPNEPVTAPRGAVKITETTLTLATYGYEDALLPTAPDDPIYPYPRLDQEKVTQPVPQAYRAIVLENDYVAVIILPELGGRIYRWVDKSTGRSLLYENPVIKPTGWGYRGWWLAAGGIEFAFPVEEHGLNEWRPWQVSFRQTASEATVTVSDVEDQTGLTVGASITLGADSGAMQISPWVRNDTATSQSFQYWLNAMVTLGGNTVSGNTQIIVPADQVTVHSTGDESLPGEWQPMDWPVYSGRDLSRYGNWSNYLGFFVPAITDSFVALYDTDADQGIVRSFTPGRPSGTKFFGPSTLPAWLWTDDDSGYVELWSGITPSFAEMTTLAPGDSTGWSERWYPVHSIGTVTGANADAALALLPNEDTVEIGGATTSALNGTLTLWQAGTAVMDWEVTITPASPFKTSWTGATSGDDALGLTLTASGGKLVLQVGTAPRNE